MKHFVKYACQYCGRMISNSGFAAAAHLRKHVREGLLIETTGAGGCSFKLAPKKEQEPSPA